MHQASLKPGDVPLPAWLAKSLGEPSIIAAVECLRAYRIDIIAVVENLRASLVRQGLVENIGGVKFRNIFLS